jgi:hypothetical protein
MFLHETVIDPLEIPHLLCYSQPPLYPIQIYSVSILTRYSFKIPFNIFLPSMTTYSNFTLSFGYSK